MVLVKKWWRVLRLGPWYVVAKRIVKGLCWTCGGHPDVSSERSPEGHAPGCTGEHLSERPWLRLRWALAMIPLGVVAISRTLIGLPFLALIVVGRLGLKLLGFYHRSILNGI